MNFFDKKAVFYPWPEILRQSGFSITYKPREVWWSKWLKKLNIKKGEKILEVGCGRGVFLDRLIKDYGIKGYGIDISKKSIIEAKKKTYFSPILKVADVTSLPFSDAFFDIVLSFDTLEHVKEQEKAVKEMVRVLKRNGRILIYTINKKQKFTFNWWLEKLGIDVYKNVDHNPKLFIDPSWLKDELEKEGVSVLNIAYFNSFFTLFLDEIIMISLKTFNRFLTFKKEGNFGMIILKILTLVSKVLTPFLYFLEFPWRYFGYSNGFLILGEKP